MSDDFPTRRAALCVGHPGHELKVYGWLRRLRPVCAVLTDGSGPDRPPRLESTRRVLENAGGTVGGVFGRFTDREIYDLMLAGDPAPFTALARELAEEWRREGVDCVIGDMLEGFSTTHDLCRMLINAAIEHSRRRWGVTLANWEFALESMLPPAPRAGQRELMLDDAGFAAKHAAAIAAYPELASEVDRLVAKYGAAAFQRELLLPAPVPAGLAWEEAEPPFYESYGRRQVGAGHYHALITYHDHIRPLARALWDWANAA